MRPVSERRRPPLQVRLTPEEEAWITARCERLDLTRAQVIHDALDLARGVPAGVKERTPVAPKRHALTCKCAMCAVEKKR